MTGRLQIAAQGDDSYLGGSKIKILFLHVFGSKFSVLSPPFYRIPKFRSLAPKLPDLSGWVGGPGGHFRQFGEM